MKTKLIFAATAAFALVAGAPAQAAKSQDRQSSESEGGGAEAKAKGERKICRTFQRTESRMKSDKICMTRAEWKKFDAQQE
jgi:Ni/Co efflux regulator RcnB